MACHRVAENKEEALVERLLQSNMVQLVPEEQLHHDKHGNLLVGGLFAVRKIRKRIALFMIDDPRMRFLNG